MKLAIIAESFLPHMNGVTGSILQIARHLGTRGHEILIVAPDAGEISPETRATLHNTRIDLVGAVPFPLYPEVRVATASVGKIERMLRAFGPDVVHLASPFVLGWAGVRAADALQLPTVGVYQTDVAGFAAKYGLPTATAFAEAHVARVHKRATLTLVPSSSARDFISSLGVDRLRHWGRGVDMERFRPERRDESWRSGILAESSRDDVIVGYVGRLSPEKQVSDLAALHDLPGVRLVVVGDGPSRSELERLLPRAHFTGFLAGTELATAIAGFDVFVHPGEHETFCQTIQEAMASGVPVVATGRGGPVDLVQSSVNGWLYRPGDLGDLRQRVADLTGDSAKRAAFSSAAHASVRGRTWSALTDQLLEYYDEARELRGIDDSLTVRPRIRPRSEPPAPVQRARHWGHYVALGDSITEGLCDTSRMPPGEYLGWADRLAMLLARDVDEHPDGAAGAPSEQGIHYANLAIRSRRMEHLTEQVDRALELSPELASVLIGSNDLVGARVNVTDLISSLERQILRLRTAGAEVLLGTTFLPQRRSAAFLLARRFVEYNEGVRRIATDHGCILLDVESFSEIRALDMWADDRVHLNSAGHRQLAYRAAEVLGVPHASQLRRLETALHAQHASDAKQPIADAVWVREHALPWVWRRVRGRTAGDGRSAKHENYDWLIDSSSHGAER